MLNSRRLSSASTPTLESHTSVNTSITSSRTRAEETTESPKWTTQSTLKSPASRNSANKTKCKRAPWTASSQWSRTFTNIASAIRHGFTIPKCRRERTDSQHSRVTRFTEAKYEDCSSHGVESPMNGSRRDSFAIRTVSDLSLKAECLFNGPPKSTHWCFTWPLSRTKSRKSRTPEKFWQIRMTIRSTLVTTNWTPRHILFQKTLSLRRSSHHMFLRPE